MNRRNGNDPGTRIFDQRALLFALIFVFSLVFSIRQVGNLGIDEAILSRNAAMETTSGSGSSRGSA